MWIRLRLFESDTELRIIMEQLAYTQDYFMQMHDLMCLFHSINNMRNVTGAMGSRNTKVLLHITAHINTIFEIHL